MGEALITVHLSNRGPRSTKELLEIFDWLTEHVNVTTIRGVDRYDPLTNKVIFKPITLRDIEYRVEGWLTQPEPHYFGWVLEFDDPGYGVLFKLRFE